jgi:hypothetical protein
MRIGYNLDGGEGEGVDRKRLGKQVVLCPSSPGYLNRDGTTSAGWSNTREIRRGNQHSLVRR